MAYKTFNESAQQGLRVAFKQTVREDIEKATDLVQAWVGNVPADKYSNAEMSVETLRKDRTYLASLGDDVFDDSLEKNTTASLKRAFVILKMQGKAYVKESPESKNLGKKADMLFHAVCQRKTLEGYSFAADVLKWKYSHSQLNKNAALDMADIISLQKSYQDGAGLDKAKENTIWQAKSLSWFGDDLHDDARIVHENISDLVDVYLEDKTAASLEKAADLVNKTFPYYKKYKSVMVGPADKLIAAGIDLGDRKSLSIAYRASLIKHSAASLGSKEKKDALDQAKDITGKMIDTNNVKALRDLAAIVAKPYKGKKPEKLALKSSDELDMSVDNLDLVIQKGLDMNTRETVAVSENASKDKYAAVKGKKAYRKESMIHFCDEGVAIAEAYRGFGKDSDMRMALAVLDNRMKACDVLEKSRELKMRAAEFEYHLSMQKENMKINFDKVFGVQNPQINDNPYLLKTEKYNLN